MTKKIGCVIAYTPGHTNYGTSLVGYALLKKIQSLGFLVEVINYKKRLSIIQKIVFVVNAVRAGEMKTLLMRADANRVMRTHPEYAESIKKRVHAVESYKAKKLIPLFRDYIGYDALHEGSKNYDVVVVGSDQVWTPLSLPNKFFNLLFVDDSVRKVAYASSFGVSVIPKFQRKETGYFLDRFYKIGVREERGKEIVDVLSNQKAIVVADPTMLLCAKEWEDEIYKDTDRKESEPYIFCYFLGTNFEARKAAELLKMKTGYKIITLRHMDEYYASDETFGDFAPYDVDPNGFLRLIHDAEYVLTDSFHCSAFSIQFHKQFMTFYRFAQGCKTGRNSRIDSLFNVLGIKRERIFNGDIMQICNPVEWDAIDDKLKKLRNESIEFLITSLG
ncbi:MAG: polysaccharide pyruvyl transferase family protein [Bacteroides sp.]|nr:polysaccharide pyruvyl transferase family protein [Roseburia sp.]MCM1346149.1 polysaccharide pyruvyl transferase family protein [Bacteroides sp.]MCM1439893.1 polysaccharide pyruvyl transferase family protein [Roseburia sp.]